ncbi:MAG: hypothetical protein B6D56_03480 [Candidatus Omnitrophica bacterium 4484_70.1]|nr:MAG: hypothetical protein B6D56_03480 [Candidatus Omnitrophica bacterium 4484_70.1]
MERQKFNLQDYWYMVLRRKWFFITPLVIIYSAFLISSYILPKIYQAQAVMLIEEKKVVNPLLKNLAVPTTPQERLNSLREEILAWPRLFQLVERLGLNKNMKNPLELERLILSIRRNIRLRLKSKEIIIISFQGKEPKKVQKLVNTLCSLLIERNYSSQQEDTESAIDFIKEQLAIYKKKLDESEAKLRKFKEVYGLQKIPKKKSSLDTKGGEYSEIRYPLTKINEEIADLEAELVISSVDCTEEHPRLKEIKRRIELLKEKRNNYIKEIAQKIGVDPQEYIEIADSLPRQEEELRRLTRDKAINEKIYAMLLERLESAKITGRLDSSENRTRFKIIEPARLPLFPVKPNKLKFNLLGLIMGGMIGACFVYFLEYTDTSFKSSQELKEYFGYPVLGSISKMITAQDLEDNKRRTKRIALLLGLGILIFILVILVVTYFINF